MSDSCKEKYFICRTVKLRYIIYAIFTEILLRRHRVFFYYLHKNKLSLFFTKFNNKLKLNRLGISFIYFEYDIKIKNDKGVPLLISSALDDLYAIIDNIEADCADNGFLFKSLPENLIEYKDDIHLYVRQQIGAAIVNNILLVNVAQWLGESRDSGIAGKDLTVIIDKKSYWDKLVEKFAGAKGVRSLFFSNVSYIFRQKIVFLYYFCMVAVEACIPFFKKRDRGTHADCAKAAVLLNSNKDFTDFFNIKNYELFWQHGSTVDPKSVICYASDRRFNLSKNNYSSLLRSGFDVILCGSRFFRYNQARIPVYCCTRSLLRRFVHHLAMIINMRYRINSCFQKEYWKILAVLLIQLPYWEDFFTANNIKVKFSPHAIFSIPDMAAKISGTVTMAYHYSHQLDMTILHQEVCDIFFIWGQHYESILSKKYTTTKVLVKTGYSFDYTFPYFKDRSKSLRQSLLERGVVYVIGIFDENINCFARAQVAWYQAILDHVKNDPTLGLVIKPKKDFAVNTLRSLPETSSRILDLESQGRIKIVDSSKYPSEAGQACDIVIGVVPDSTAALECALAGGPMVTYDMYSMRSRLAYVQEYNKVIFDDIHILLQSLDKNREHLGSVPGFADWSLMLDRVDPFRDGQASQRIGFYIKNILDGFDKNLSKEEAIYAANKVYADVSGRDKIIAWQEKFKL